MGKAGPDLSCPAASLGARQMTVRIARHAPLALQSGWEVFRKERNVRRTTPWEEEAKAEISHARVRA
jgi:hypothetical protein